MSGTLVTDPSITEKQIATLNHIVGTYRNELTVDNLMKLIIHDYDSDFIVISWYITGFWYVAAVYDKNIKAKVDVTGWYLNEEPSIDNLPFVHSIIDRNKIATIQTKLSKIIYLVGTPINFDRVPTPISNPVESIRLFMLETIVDRLALTDTIKRQKYRQELMLSNISHSIRTPLNGILHMTNAIASTSGIPANAIEPLKYLNQSSVALATNIFDIIDMTKLELSKLVLNKEVFNLHDLIKSIMDLAASLNKSNFIELDYYIDGSVPEYIYSDPKRIKQILINILENSLQHTTNGSVFLHVISTIVDLASEDSTQDHSFVELPGSLQHSIIFSVRDTGPGIDEQTKNNLFKPSELLINAKQSGTSLRVSYMLASLLGGNLKLAFSELNKGTCFEFNLISYEEEPPVIVSTTLKQLRDKSILLVDTTNDRLMLCQVFEKYKMRYTIATSYEEVFVLHSMKKFDLIIIKYTTINELLIKSIKSKLDSIYLSIGEPTKDFDYSMNELVDILSIKNKLLEIFSSRKPLLTSNQIRILVVEDEQINRIVIEKVLRQLGYKYITLASNGDQALKLYSTDPENYTILLIDIRMPLMTGFELADKIHDINPSAKMIGVTAQVVIEDDIKPWFKDFIYKPIDFKELDKKIKELVKFELI